MSNEINLQGKKWAKFEVQIPRTNPSGAYGECWNFSMHGWEDDIFPDVEKLIQAYRAIGIEIRVYQSKTEQVVVNV